MNTIVWTVGNVPDRDLGWYLVTIQYLDTGKRAVCEAWYNKDSPGKWYWRDLGAPGNTGIGRMVVAWAPLPPAYMGGINES